MYVCMYINIYIYIYMYTLGGLSAGLGRLRASVHVFIDCEQLSDRDFQLLGHEFMDLRLGTRFFRSRLSGDEPPGHDFQLSDVLIDLRLGTREHTGAPPVSRFINGGCSGNRL